MTGRCRTCPHWYGTLIGGGWGICDLGGATYSGERASSETMAYGTGYDGGALNTHAAFGCVMHPENGGARLVADNMVLESSSEGMKTCFQRDLPP